MNTEDRDFLVDVTDRLARIETKLDGIGAQDHERRITRLERMSWIVLGVSLAAGGMAAHVGQFLAV